MAAGANSWAQLRWRANKRKTTSRPSERRESSREGGEEQEEGRRRRRRRRSTEAAWLGRVIARNSANSPPSRANWATCRRRREAGKKAARERANKQELRNLRKGQLHGRTCECSRAARRQRQRESERERGWQKEAKEKNVRLCGNAKLNSTSGRPTFERNNSNRLRGGGPACLRLPGTGGGLLGALIGESQRRPRSNAAASRDSRARMESTSAANRLQLATCNNNSKLGRFVRPAGRPMNRAGTQLSWLRTMSAQSKCVCSLFWPKQKVRAQLVGLEM